MQGLPAAVLLTIAFNCAIAALLTLVGFGGTFLENLVYSQCIGLTILLVVEGGWRLFWHRARPPARAMAALVALGILAGWVGGTALAAALLEHPWQPARSGGAVLAITAAAGLAGTFFFWSREHAARLERQGAEARLKLLQAQVEPHFLFNTLANLHALIAADPKRAQAMLDHLNGYLRAALAAARRDRSTLADEFALLGDYLEILAIRMGERLRYRLDLPAALAGAELPPMLLQPLVENAVKHGLEPRVEGGEIMVSALERGARLLLEVKDSGLGLGAAATSGTGAGIAQVRERLAALYGAGASLEVSANPAGGVTAALSLPLAR